MIRLERAHQNIQNIVLQNAWVEDAVFEVLKNDILDLPPSAVVFIGACIDDDALPVPMEGQSGVGFSVREYIDLVHNSEDIEPLLEGDVRVIEDVSVLYETAFKKRLLRSVYDILLRQEVALGTEMLRMLERVTEGTLVFDTDEHTTLYRKIYILLLLRYAAFVPSETWVQFFSTVLFSFAIFMEAALIPALEAHIRSSKIVQRREDMSLDFAMAVMNNPSVLGVDATGQAMTIGGWTTYINEKYTAVSQEKFFETLEADKKLLANKEPLRPFIEMVVFIYRLLVSGFFVVEPGSLKAIEKIIQEQQKQNQSELLQKKEILYPELFARHGKDLATWIHTTEALRALLHWLSGFETQAAARDAFVTLVKTQVPGIASDMDMAAALVEVDDFLQQNGYGSDDFIFFDEASGSFQYS